MIPSTIFVPDAAPIVSEERIYNRFDYRWDRHDKIRDCANKALNKRHNDLRAGHDDLRKIVKNPLYNPDNKLWRSLSKLRNGFNQAIDQRFNKFCAGFDDFGGNFQ